MRCPTMAHRRRCTIGSCDGARRASGRRHSTLWPRPRAHPPKFCSTAPTSRRIAQLLVEKRGAPASYRREPGWTEHQAACGMQRSRPTTDLPVNERQMLPIRPQALALLQTVPNGAIVMADKAYDADAIRRFIEGRRAVPKILSKTSRRCRAGYAV